MISDEIRAKVDEAEVRSHEPLSVNRVRVGNGSTVEPPMDPDWSDLDKLRWCAGVLEADTGCRINITTGGYSIGGVPQRGYYGYSMINSSGGPMRFLDMWTFLNGVAVGRETAQSADAAAQANPRVVRRRVGGLGG